MRTLVCLHQKAPPKYELILATIKDYHDSNNPNLQTHIYGSSKVIVDLALRSTHNFCLLVIANSKRAATSQLDKPFQMHGCIKTLIMESTESDSSSLPSRLSQESFLAPGSSSNSWMTSSLTLVEFKLKKLSLEDSAADMMLDLDDSLSSLYPCLPSMNLSDNISMSSPVVAYTSTPNSMSMSTQSQPNHNLFMILTKKENTNNSWICSCVFSQRVQKVCDESYGVEDITPKNKLFDCLSERGGC
jgi:hypothetical protein